ncbi:FG-GAP repeat [Ceratocystis lukuohia]|uniref:FG-GAP repeat n=1 Tax=Ceratocystis lukuohia TaxID=2019550 RepID=A0ABR4MPW2_9PEZI
MSSLGPKQSGRHHWALFTIHRAILRNFVRPAVVAIIVLVLLVIPVYKTLEDRLPQSIPIGNGRCASPGSVPLRIMPLGASITKGDPAQVSEPHHNGYRKFLRDKLREEGWAVNMVGSIRNWGDMNDNDNEGHPAWRVNQVHGRAKSTVALFKPNVILINVGTNDAILSNPELPYQETPARMEAMLRDLWDIVPDTVIVLSTLLPRDDGGKTATINKGYRALGKKLAGEGRPILMAEMDNGKTVLLSDIWDGTHPDVGGFKKMAGAWYAAIHEAHCRDWIKKPHPDVAYPDGVANKTCAPIAGASRADDRSTQSIINGNAKGIFSDGPFKAAFEEAIVSANVMVNHDSSLMFAAIFTSSLAPGDLPKDDLIIVSGSEISVMQNSGKGLFKSLLIIDNVPFQCDQAGIRFGDVNNDGFDDLLCIGTNSSVHAAINSGTNPPSFKDIGLWNAGSEGFKRGDVRLADIDGDGRLDYCLLDTKKSTGHCWRNKGFGHSPSSFQELLSEETNVFGTLVNDLSSVQFVDINGDHRFDWVQIADDGSISIKANQRSISKGFVPKWLATDEPVSLPGFEPSTDTRKTIKFGRIFGTGKSDVALVRFENCTPEQQCTLSITGFKNDGLGGKFQIGDGTRFADMRNRKIDDYVWISPTGELLLRRNKNSANNVPRFGDESYLEPISILHTDYDRRALHLADWDGDGYADVIAVDKATGQLKIWLNKQAGSGSEWLFEFEVIHVEWITCTEGWGVGYFDNGNHFADLDGDGRVDIICMAPDGLVTAYLNKATSLEYIGQIASNSGQERSSFRFTDANGDGRADMYFLDEISGDARLWLNSGMVTKPEWWLSQRNSIQWDEPRAAWFGSTSGRNEHFTDQLGNGRADLVSIDPSTGNGVVYLTVCPGSGDDSYRDTEGIPDYDYASEVAR